LSLSRKLIRSGIVALLKGATIAGNKVTDGQTDIAWEEDAPGIFVSTRREVVTKNVDVPLEYRRELEVIVEVHASRRRTAQAEDLVDDILAEVELILERNRTLPTFPDTIKIDADASGLEEVQLESTSEARVPMAIGALRWRVVYFTTYPVDEAALDQLREVRTSWDLGPSIDGLLEAVDVVKLSV